MPVRSAELLLQKPEPKLENILYLSVSKTKTFEQCKKKFHFSYIEKLSKKEFSHLYFGKLLHKTLELFHLAYINGATAPFHEVMGASFKEARNDPEWKDKITHEQLAEAKDILTIYLQQLAEAERNKTIPTFLSAEQEFWVNIDNRVLLTGFIDRMQLDGDGMLHITDYKTSKSKKYLEKDLFQLKCYGYVACLMDPSLEKIRCSYIMLKHNMDMIVEEFSRAELMKIEDIFLQKAALIEAEAAFKPTVSPLCEYCDFLDTCTDGQKFLIKIGKGNKVSLAGKMVEWGNL